MAEAATIERADAKGTGDKIRLEAWSWPAAFLAVFLVLVFAWGIGFPIRRILAGHASTVTWFAITTGALAAGSFLLLSARRAMEFFLSVRVGISILVFFILGSLVSVLVHPRDPQRYVAFDPPLTFEEQEKRHRDDFGWATGFFLYHLTHPYGWGIPKLDIPPGAKDGLARISQHYGKRLAMQEESGMRTALNGDLRGSEIREYIADNQGFFDTLYDVCSFLQMNGTPTAKGAWSSEWFTALMGLLFLLVLTNTFRRAFGRAIAQGGPGFAFVRKLPAALWWDLKSLISIQRIGFLVTHMGIMTALTGGLWSRVTEERGVVRLSINPIRDGVPNASESFSGYDGSFKRFDPPLRVRLANFRADYRDTLDIQFLDSAAKTKTIPHYRFFEIWKGRQIGLDYETGGEGSPQTIVRVLEHWPRSTVSLDLGERAANDPPTNYLESAGPALKIGFSLGLGGHGSDSGGSFLFAGDKDYSLLYDVPGIRVEAVNAKNADEQEARLQLPFEGERLGTLGVAVGVDAQTPAAMVEIKVGEEFEFPTPKGKVNVKIVRALPDARLLPVPNGGFKPQFEDIPVADVPPLHPGIQILVAPPEGRLFRTWVYENPRDSIAGQDGELELGGARVRFVVAWDRWRCPARARYRVVLGQGLPAKIGKVGTQESQTLEIGKPAMLEGAFQFEIERRADRPKLIPVIRPIPGDPDADEVFFDASNPPAARIEVDGREGKQEFVLAAAELADSATYAKRIRLTMFENTAELPREWKSKLEFLQKNAAGTDWEIKNTQTIRVNDYAKFGGYRFFQTDANRAFPGYSGVGIVKDPGIETVLVGLYAVVFGVAYVFLVKPLILRFKRP